MTVDINDIIDFLEFEDCIYIYGKPFGPKLAPEHKLEPEPKKVSLCLEPIKCPICNCSSWDRNFITKENICNKCGWHGKTVMDYLKAEVSNGQNKT
jgi:hypothetical protein